MKIAVAQIKPAKGEIDSNIASHKKFIERAISQGTDMLVFPELSLTGYEPTLAKVLAILPDDHRFDDFQHISDTHQLTMGVGVPTLHSNGICISMLLFQPHQPRQVYSKKYLHADEEAFFVSGEGMPVLKVHDTTIALAICYEISVPEHAAFAYAQGAEIYLASVAKSVSGIDKALPRLSAIARQYGMTVLMSNCIGQADGEECTGKSSVWNHKGKLMAQLNDQQEGIIILDTNTRQCAMDTMTQ